MEESVLVRLAREGNEFAIDELFTEVWPLVWHSAYAVTCDRVLAEHVAQDAIYRKLAVGARTRFRARWRDGVSDSVTVEARPYVQVLAQPNHLFSVEVHADDFFTGAELSCESSFRNRRSADAFWLASAIR